MTYQEVVAEIKQLSLSERLSLLEMLARSVRAEVQTRGAVGVLPEPERSLLELEGLGADLWQGVDPQEYVNELRKEWDHRP